MVAPTGLLSQAEIEAFERQRVAARAVLDQLRKMRGRIMGPWEKHFAKVEPDMLPVWQEAYSILDWLCSLTGDLWQVHPSLKEEENPAFSLVRDLLSRGKDVLECQVLLLEQKRSPRKKSKG